MGIGYTRQSSADIVDGLPITAAPLNNEFNAIRDTFNQTDGHSHDGTVGEGPKLDLGVSTTGTLPENRGGTGQTSVSNLPISTATQQALDLKAPINNPTFTGIPSAPTAPASTNTTQVATTAHVKSLLDSGTTLGATWTVPTAAVGTNSNLIASTAFVQAAITPKVNRTGDTMTGALSYTPGVLSVLTGGTTEIDYTTSNRRRIELRSGSNTLNIINIPESGGDLEIDALYTAGTLAFTQVIRWKLGGGAEGTNIGDTGITLTAGTRYVIILWNMGGVLYGAIA